MRNALIIIISLAPVLLSGCSLYNLAELRRATPQGTAFQKALSEFYRDFAEEEERRYDWWDSAYFAAKGLRAAFGQDVEPERVEEWAVPPGLREEMASDREALMAALMPEIKEKEPQTAAEAVMAFDCWLEQAEEDATNEDAAYCRDHVKAGLERMAQHVSTAVPDAPMPADTADYVTKVAYLLVFPVASAILTADAKAVLERVITDVKADADSVLVLKPASETELGLAEARIEAVGRVLQAHGIDAGRVSLYGFAHTENTQAPSEARVHNRRIEIIFDD